MTTFNVIYYQGNLMPAAIPPLTEWEKIEAYAYANSLALPTDTTAFDQLIKDLKTAGIWQKLDVFYVFAGDGSNGFKLINWINPEEHYADAFGGLTWDLDGVKGNGSNGYINTNFNDLNSPTLSTYDNASLFAVRADNEDTAGFLIGLTGSGTQFSTRLYSNNIGSTTTWWNYKRRGSSGAFDFSGNGLKMIARHTGSGNTSEVTNRDNHMTRSVVVNTAAYNQSRWILRSSSNYGSHKVSMVGWGEYLNPLEAQSFRTIYNNFLTAIGQAPVA